MVMTAQQAIDVAQDLRKSQSEDRQELDILRRYWKGTQPLPAVIPSDAPAEVREMARVARVNIIKIVIESITQSLLVMNIRTPDERDDNVVNRAWEIWQANRMDARQSGLVRATTAYGTGYMVVLPGNPAPVMRPVSPRRMTAMYGEDDAWPMFALEYLPRAGAYRLYDDTGVYPLRMKRGNSDGMELAGDVGEHRAGVTPVVKFRDAEDLDEDDEPETGLAGGGLRLAPRSKVTAGQVAPLVELQDQMNLTSFGLKAAEWYSAFRQRWAIGYKPGSTTEKMQAAASQFWTFDEDPDRMRIGEFGQTDLRGYLESRGESAKFAATLSQTPVHELVGELVNLSAEALAAAEIGRDRMVGERKTGQGESFEQSLRLACSYEGLELPEDAEVIYEDTSARAFGAVVDALGKIAQMLQVPPRALWSKIPGVTKQEVERWEKMWEEGDSIAQLNDLLAGQGDPAGGGDPGTGGERRSAGGIILPPGARV